MIRISDIRIGTKLAVSLGFGVLLVASVMASQHVNNERVSDSLAAAQRQPTIRHVAVEAKASVRGMQIGLRDLRIAATPEQVKAAEEYFKDRFASVNKYADALLTVLINQANRGRMEAVRADAGKYAAG